VTNDDCVLVGKSYTMDDSRPLVEAVAIRNGKIAYIGAAPRARARRGPGPFGRHDRSPPARARAAGVDRQVETNGQRHAAEGGYDWDPDAGALAQLAEIELALDL
jgi:hypothetical protein